MTKTREIRIGALTARPGGHIDEMDAAIANWFMLNGDLLCEFRYSPDMTGMLLRAAAESHGAPFEEFCVRMGITSGLPKRGTYQVTSKSVEVPLICDPMLPSKTFILCPIGRG